MTWLKSKGQVCDGGGDGAEAERLTMAKRRGRR